MKILSKSLFVFLILSFLMLSFSWVIAQEKPIKAELPVLLTSCGQSPGPMTLKVIMERRAKIKPIYNLQATAD